MKWTKNDIERAVCKDIEEKEQLGDQASSSGHLSFVSYQLDYTKEPLLTPNGYLVEYGYTLIIETEFTYYPDNPPYENKRTGQILLEPWLIRR